MKTRNGFVSNSSSSSFIIAYDSDLFPKGEDAIRAAFSINTKNPIVDNLINVELINALTANMNPINFKELADDDGYDSLEDFLKERESVQKLHALPSNWKFAIGTVYSDEGGIGECLYNSEFVEIDFEYFKLIQY